MFSFFFEVMYNLFFNYLIFVRFNGNFELVVELVIVNGFKFVYVIKDGVEGFRGWMVCVFFSFFIF